MKRTLEEVIAMAINYRQAELRVCMPGTVITYYAATQTADIQPPVWTAIPASGTVQIDGSVTEGGTIQDQLPILFNIPVEFPRGGGYAITFPLVPGDTGMLEFPDFSIDLWRSSGLDGPSQDLRTHSIGSAVFRPGLSCSLVPIAGAPATTADGLAIGAELGQRIQITQTAVALGSPTATDFVALASKVDLALSTFKTALLTAITAGGAASFMDAGVAFNGALTTLLATWPAPTGSVVVKSV